jgi:hypothetical protein
MADEVAVAKPIRQRPASKDGLQRQPAPQQLAPKEGGLRKKEKREKIDQERSRILFSDADQMIVFTNFKVGFTSLNQTLPKLGWSTEIRAADKQRPLMRERRRYVKAFIYRDPAERLVSYYKNWIIDKAPDYVAPGGSGNHGFQNIKRFFPKQLTRAFYEATQEELRSKAFFESWLENLQYSWHRDRHTQPQHMIYTEFALGIEDMRYVVPLPKLNDWMKEKLRVELPTGNRSNSQEVSHFLTGKVQDFTRFVYVRDYRDFVGTEKL